MPSINYSYLTLKPEYREQFLQKARSRFPGRHIKGTWEAVNEILDPDKPRISDDTIRRILTIDGHRGLADKVDAVCSLFGPPWYEACIEGNNLSDIEDRISEIRKKVEADLFSNTRRLNTQQLNRRLNHDFIELSLIEVTSLPSDYPPVADPNALVDSSHLTEEDFDRMGINLLRGKKKKIKEVINGHHNIFVYGDPGSGKTTCLQWMTLKCCQREALQAVIPVFVGARWFASTTEHETLQEWIEKRFSQWGCTPAERNEILESGQAVFILDGIDEIAVTERERIETEIERLLQNYERCRFIFSSRLGREFPFSGGFQKVIIAPLQKAQIRKFVENWFGQPGKDIALADHMLKKLRSKAYRGIRELSQRPILLDLLCVVFESQADLPRRRFEVFRKGIDLMTRKNVSLEEGGSSFKTLRELDVQNILCKIANYFFLKRKIIFPTLEVESTIQDYYEIAYNRPRSLVPSRLILQGIEQSNGLLVRWADNFCTFSHLTYQEFFTADELVRNNRYQEVYEHIDKARWKFVIGLISECLSYEYIWGFLCGFKFKIDSTISDEPVLLKFLEEVERIAASTVQQLDSNQPHLESYARAWYFVYALKDTGRVTNVGAVYRYFDLPDFEFATSMIDGKLLETHECVYKLYHDFEQKIETPQGFINALQRLQDLLIDDFQNYEVVKGWLEFIRQQCGDFSDLEEWWQYKRNYWQGRIIRFITKLKLPCAVELTPEQRDKLHAYYNATKLFSTCMTRSLLDDLQREKVVDSMLSTQTLVSEE
ncbi:putative NTPase (NACHT family) [Leptolyngbya sp. PCC 7375]|nr:putative NTPase (NACHT family) [Leptolyngbya sp. PCC 7375]